MATSGAGLDAVEVPQGASHAIEQERVSNEKDASRLPGYQDEGGADADLLSEPEPTFEEMNTLRHIHGEVSWLIYSIGIVEMVERFAYYGTTAVFVNFIAMPLPEGSTTGSAGTHGQAGALGLGQQVSFSVTMFNSFWSYVMPLLGGYLADTYWGRYATIQWAILIAIIGHIIIIVAAIPSVIANPQGALGCFIVGLLFFGTGVGWFKANISPLIAEQYELVQPHPTVRTLATGERVIVDPVMTISRVYMRYYFLINTGALVGQISMVYAEKYVGFWLSYLLPTVLFLLCPIIMIACRKRYAKRPPTGSVLGNTIALVSYGIKKNGIRGINKDSFWQSIRPSQIADKPAFMTFDDAWVDEVRRGLKACAVFMWFPIFWLAYNQMNSNLINQSGSMKLNGVPNDVVTNLNPFSLLILIPLCDKLFYPALARAGIRFSPIKKISLGFFSAALSMVVAAIIQHFIYQKAPCGYQATNDRDCYESLGPPDITVWVQTPAFVLIALSEVLASITGLEYAFTKAPKNMRGLVTGVFWFVHAFSSAVAQAFTGLATDPLLVWLYTTVAIISALGGIGFWFSFRKLDKEEEELNALPESTYVGRGEKDVEEKAVS